MPLIGQRARLSLRFMEQKRGTVLDIEMIGLQAPLMIAWTFVKAYGNKTGMC